MLEAKTLWSLIGSAESLPDTLVMVDETDREVTFLGSATRRNESPRDCMTVASPGRRRVLGPAEPDRHGPARLRPRPPLDRPEPVPAHLPRARALLRDEADRGSASRSPGYVPRRRLSCARADPRGEPARPRAARPLRRPTSGRPRTLPTRPTRPRQRTPRSAGSSTRPGRPRIRRVPGTRMRLSTRNRWVWRTSST